jgi:thiol-disulfide isomerase/thioredoxin
MMELNEIQKIIAAKPAVMIYFYNDNCAPCKVLRPKVQEMVENDFPNIEFRLINAEKYPSTTAQFGVFSSPAILVFFETKEYIRESKNISISELHDKIERIYTMVFLSLIHISEPTRPY